MVRYMLDTNIISDLIRNPAGRAAQRVREVGEAAICTSIIVAAELKYGCVKKGSADLERRVQALLAELPVLALTAPADEDYGSIRAALEESGQIIGQNDLLVAAQARATGAIMVTANEAEFRRVPGLRVENWLA